MRVLDVNELPLEMSDTSRNDVSLESDPRSELACLEPGPEETAHTWDIINDRLSWEDNACELLGLLNMDQLSTGDGFQFLVVAEHLARRQKAFDGKADPYNTRGMPYCVA